MALTAEVRRIEPIGHIESIRRKSYEGDYRVSVQVETHLQRKSLGMNPLMNLLLRKSFVSKQCIYEGCNPRDPINDYV